MSSPKKKKVRGGGPESPKGAPKAWQGEIPASMVALPQTPPSGSAVPHHRLLSGSSTPSVVSPLPYEKPSPATSQRWDQEYATFIRWFSAPGKPLSLHLLHDMEVSTPEKYSKDFLVCLNGLWYWESGCKGHMGAFHECFPEVRGYTSKLSY